MIHAPNELREVAVGAQVNLFVSVGQTSRRLKGTVSATRERGTGDEVLEVHVAERSPGAAEIVFWLGFTDEETFLLPLDDEDEALVYVKYKHNGGQTGLYIDSVREVGVRDPSAEPDPTADGTTAADETASRGVTLSGESTKSKGPAAERSPDDGDDRSRKNERNTLQ